MRRHLLLLAAIFTVVLSAVTVGFNGSTDLACAGESPSWPAPPARTGQTSCYDAAGNVLASCVGTGQTGDTLSGVAWPTPRFTANGDGTVTDNLTGLIWLQDAQCLGTQTWTAAVTSTATLATGQCGLTDGSSAGQWRLPNVLELRSLVNEQQTNNATWLSSLGFSNVQAYNYWSSSTYAFYTSYAWVVNLFGGFVDYYDKTYPYYVWPVRGGQ